MTHALKEIESTEAPPAIPPKVFDGIKLQPFSPMRQIVALSLGGVLSLLVSYGSRDFYAAFRCCF